ncbi:MAG: DUF3320 domain-containing protein [Methylobacteriaceae bacterium]|nr:DUF3320 domain-containing protein [Methylobacteriaceae bacterium]
MPALSKMVSHVVATEAPIYFDQIVTRIARAHGFQRNGGNIVETVRRAIDRRFPRSVEDGRELVWPLDATPEAIVPLRNGDLRDHADIPVVELAGLALPHVAGSRLGDEEILERMRAHFGLARLREPTRLRFLAAIKVARGINQ